ncbi:MAG: AraC family transcriptional regulator [Spirochaetota bacterium]
MNDASFAPYRIPDKASTDSAVRELFSGHLTGKVSLSEKGKRHLVVPFVRREERLTQHDHDYLEIVFVLSGSGRHTVGQRTYTVGAGDIFFLDNETPHGFSLARGERCVYVNFSFLPEVLDRTFSMDALAGGVHFFLIEPFFREDDDFSRRLTIAGDVFERFRHCALLAVDTFFHSYPAPATATQAVFRSFIELLHDEYGRAIASRPEIYAGREAIYREILAEVDSRLAEKFTLNDIAGSVGIGRTRIAEIFREKRGETIVEYANRRRVESAEKLLRESDMSIVDAALNAGFNDTSNFNRIFKKITGKTPAAYRSGR